MGLFQDDAEFLEWYLQLTPAQQLDTRNLASSQTFDSEAFPRVSQMAYEIFGTGSQTLTTADVVVDLGIEVASSDFFSVSAGTITYTGPDANFQVVYKVSADATTNSRSVMRSAIFLNNVEQTRTRSYSYHRTTADGEDTAKSTNIIALTSGDTVDVRSRENSGGDVISVLRDYSNITIIQII